MSREPGTTHWGIRTVREAFLRVALFASSAIIVPYSIWEYGVEPGSFSRIPVTIGIALLCGVTFLLYFSTTIRFRYQLTWRRTFWTAVLIVVLGFGFAGVLSVMLFPFICEVIANARERRGLRRPAFSPNLGMLLVVLEAVVVFPFLNEMYTRGAQAKLWHTDYNKRNIFYEINVDGFRGPRVPIARSRTPRLLFIGNSSTFGWPYRWEESYPFLVKDILKSQGIDVEVVNAATIGHSDGQIRAQLPYFLQYRPDLVFMMSGFHYHRAGADYQRILREGVSRETGWRPFFLVPPFLIEIVGFSLLSSPVLALLHHIPSAARVAEDDRELESFKTQLRAIVQQIRDSGAHLYLVDYPTPGAERRVENEIRRIAQESGTDYIPLFDLIGTQIKNELHDPVHPNREGHRLIAQEIAKVAAAALVPSLPDSTARVRP